MTDRDAAKKFLSAVCSGTLRSALSGPTPYAGQLVDWAEKYPRLTIKTVSRPRDATGFVVLPRHWVVDRTLTWLMPARRHACDYERLVQHSEALIT